MTGGAAMTVLDHLRDERLRGNDTGLTASRIASNLGNTHGGRSTAGELGRLLKTGDIEIVRRTDGRIRPLLYRAVGART